MIDSDVLVPINTIEVLRSHGKDLVSGYYLSSFRREGKVHVLPLVWGFKEGFFARQLDTPEVIPPRLLRVVMTGLGCTLIS